MTIQRVNDFLSNVEENVQAAARAVRGKTRRKVFSAVYTGKAKVKTVEQIMKGQKLTHVAVLMAGRPLATLGLIGSTKLNGRIAFEKVAHIQEFKDKILRLAGSPKKREAMHTKRNPRQELRPAGATVRVVTAGRKVREITIDEIESFSRVLNVTVDDFIPRSISEVHFRQAVQRILGELGTFKDWGGEQNDLYTSRVKVNGKRVVAAFAFKGPATSGALTLDKMGARGDQIQRLFTVPARLFVVQYGGQVKQAIPTDMRAHAFLRAPNSGEAIYYCLIDGTDSHRLLKSYPKAFKDATPKKKRKKYAK